MCGRGECDDWQAVAEWAYRGNADQCWRWIRLRVNVAGGAGARYLAASLGLPLL